jgi:hypothetical protein
MNIDDFLEAVASEPPRVVSRTVRTVLPEALAAARKRGGILLEAFLALPATMETREVEYRHIVGPPASIGAVEQWKKQHPAHSLPAGGPSLGRQPLGSGLRGTFSYRRMATGASQIL